MKKFEVMFQPVLTETIDKKWVAKIRLDTWAYEGPPMDSIERAFSALIRQVNDRHRELGLIPHKDINASEMAIYSSIQRAFY